MIENKKRQLRELTEQLESIQETSQLKRLNDLKEILETLLMNEQQKLKYFLKELDYIKPKVVIRDEVIEIKKEDIIKVLKLFRDRYEVSVDEIEKAVYVYLVKENKLFLNPQKGILKPQSFLVWNAIKKLL